MKIQDFVLNYRKSCYGTYEALLVANEVSVCQVSCKNSQKQSSPVGSSEKTGVRLAYSDAPPDSKRHKKVVKILFETYAVDPDLITIAPQ